MDGESIANPETTPYDERFLTGDPFTQYGTAGSGTRVESFGISATANYEISDNLSFKSITSYRDLKSLFGEDADFSPLVIDHHVFEMEQSQFTQEFQFTGNSERLNWVAGLYYFQEDGFLFNNVPLAGGILQINGGEFVNTNSYAAFGQVNYNITEKFSITAGVRYTTDQKEFEGTEEEINLFYTQLGLPDEAFPDPNDPARLYPVGVFEETFNSLDFRLGMEYQFNDDFMAYASFAQGFKSGGFATRLTAPILEVPQFDPEEADTYEIGFKSQFGNKLRLNVAAFYTDYKNLQIVVQRAVSPTLENAAEAEIKGLEMDLSYVPFKNFTVNGSLGILDSKYTRVDEGAAITVDNELVNAPNTTLSLSGDLVTPFNSGSKLLWHLDYSFKSTIYNNSENTASLVQDDYGLLNAALTYKHKNDKWSLRAGVTNLTNKAIIVSGFFQPGVGYTLATWNRPIFANLTLGFKI